MLGRQVINVCSAEKDIAETAVDGENGWMSSHLYIYHPYIFFEAQTPSPSIMKSTALVYLLMSPV